MLKKIIYVAEVKLVIRSHVSRINLEKHIGKEPMKLEEMVVKSKVERLLPATGYFLY